MNYAFLVKFLVLSMVCILVPSCSNVSADEPLTLIEDIQSANQVDDSNLPFAILMGKDGLLSLDFGSEKVYPDEQTVRIFLENKGWIQSKNYCIISDPINNSYRVLQGETVEIEPYGGKQSFRFFFGHDGYATYYLRFLDLETVTSTHNIVYNYCAKSEPFHYDENTGLLNFSLLSTYRLRFLSENTLVLVHEDNKGKLIRCIVFDAVQDSELAEWRALYID